MFQYFFSRWPEGEVFVYGVCVVIYNAGGFADLASRCQWSSQLSSLFAACNQRWCSFQVIQPLRMLCIVSLLVDNFAGNFSIFLHHLLLQLMKKMLSLDVLGTYPVLVLNSSRIFLSDHPSFPNPYCSWCSLQTNLPFLWS